MKASTPLGLLILLTCVNAHAQVGSLPAPPFGYVMSQQSSTLLVVDTSTNDIITKVTHPDMIKPAWGRFHPSQQRYYAGGTGKVTIWDTTDVAHPVYLKTVIPAPSSTGEYRGFLIYQGSTTAIDGNVWIANIQDSRVYVYRAADLEGANPTPVKVFDATTDGISFPHLIMRRPGTEEVWLTNRPVNANAQAFRRNDRGKGLGALVMRAPRYPLAGASSVSARAAPTPAVGYRRVLSCEVSIIEHHPKKELDQIGEAIRLKH
jgi:hypothetical protein